MNETQKLTSKAKEILKDLKYMKAFRLARMLGLEGLSGSIIAGRILASLPEWTVNRKQTVRRLWTNNSR